MALTLPPVIPLAASLGNETALIPVSVAAALSGAVFGDHTSPFSDTTIISAAASGCDPWDHVRTQWPYALTAAGIAALAGFLPVGFGLPAWLGLATCLLSLYLFVSWKSGRRLLPVN
jgi:Na+/H+ antiporter NhaC